MRGWWAAGGSQLLARRVARSPSTPVALACAAQSLAPCSAFILASCCRFSEFFASR